MLKIKGFCLKKYNKRVIIYYVSFLFCFKFDSILELNITITSIDGGKKMNKQKLITAGCIVLSIVFSLSVGLFIHFKAFLPGVNNVYEKTLYYSEDLYEEYYKEAVRMIANKEYSCKYPVKTTIYSENDRTTLIIEIGDYDDGYRYSDYMTATVKNLGTDEQEMAFERSRKSAEEAYELAENYRNMMNIFTVCFVLMLIAFTAYLVINSIKRHYFKVFAPMIVISACVVIVWAMFKFLIAS